MKIESLKDLEKLVKLCRKAGIQTLKADGIEFTLGVEPYKAPRQRFEDPMASTQIPTPNIMDNDQLDPIQAAKLHAAQQLKQLQDYIETDEISDDQKLFYSARVEAGHEQ